MACKPPEPYWPWRGYLDPGWAEPCLSRLQPPGVSLSQLQPEKKRMVWQHIQTQHPDLAGLLTSGEFDYFKRQLTAYFGPVEIGVNLQDIGGSLYGVRRQTKTRN